MEFTHDELRGYVADVCGVNDDGDMSHVTMSDILKVMQDTLIQNASVRHDSQFTYSVCDEMVETPRGGIYGHRELAEFDRQNDRLTEKFFEQE